MGIGGLVGYYWPRYDYIGEVTLEINQCSNKGECSGGSYIGGLVGYISGNGNIVSNVIIKNSYNEAKIIGRTNGDGCRWLSGIYSWKY